jgi:hypothetical protein
MKIFFDTEFLDGDDDINLLSIGMVREDGKTYYAELHECDKSLANDWVKENVFPHLTGPVKFKEQIVQDLLNFCGDEAEFWAYGIPDLDYNLVMRLFGWKIPKSWSKGDYDVMSVFQTSSWVFPPKQKTIPHNALNDALWAKEIYESQS